jgi:biopolymer transport protein ExbD
MRVDLDEQESTEIGFAPLIDCIFLLLIFFLVATSFKKQEEIKENLALGFELPKSTASFDWGSIEAAPLVVGVDKEGIFYLHNQPISVQDLHNFLIKEKENNPQQRVRIDGDQQTPYQNIVHIMDVLQFNGLTNIGLHTRE